MKHIGDVVAIAIENLLSRMERRDNVVPFPTTSEMRIRLAIVRQIKREREAR